MKLAMPIKAALAASSLALLAACGGGSADATMTVTPALGAVYNADVNVYNATGQLVGTGTTGTAGTVDLSMYGSITAPLAVVVTANANTTYFNEKTGANEALATGTNMMTVAPSARASVGVSALTTMAAKMAGVTPGNVRASMTSVTKDKIDTGVSKTLAVLGLSGVTAAYDLFQATTPAKDANWASSLSGFSLLVANISKAATGTPAEQLKAFDDAVDSDGKIVAAAATTFTALNTQLKTVSIPNVTIQTVTEVSEAAISTLAEAIKTAVSTVTAGGTATGATAATGS